MFRLSNAENTWNDFLLGQYGNWTYVHHDSDYYCQYGPFMFAFVVLIFLWVTIPFLICCACCFFTSTFGLAGLVGVSGMAEAAYETLDWK